MSLSGRPPIWTCHPNLLVCRAGHVQTFHKTGFHVDQSRVDGHLVIACDTCKPKTFAFAVIHSRPSPIVHCYDITREQYDQLRDTPDDRMDPPLEDGRETEDLLHRLGYNPNYQRRSA